ncbi:MAG TPA: hypothetical protein VF797_10730 [Noviherbaspirillum sp.]
MNEEKNAIGKQDGNSHVESSAIISDLELNDVAGGYSYHAKIDKKNKTILVVPEGGAKPDDLFFRESCEIKYYRYIDYGYKIKYGTDAQQGKQVI